jgi:hypothetical protein
VWRTVLLPPTIKVEHKRFVPPFEAWLRKRLQANVGYDRIVRAIITSESPDRDGASLEAFAEALDRKPENLAASTSRLFLGIKLECAQCHNHPHARWTRQQFWEFAAFFSSEIKHPISGKILSPRTPVGESPIPSKGADNKLLLARWMTSPANPYFGRVTVNRVWRYFFGRGLVEPVDETGNAGSHAYSELLDKLTRDFIARGYDLRFLVQSIVATQAYQRGSGSEAGSHEPEHFTHMAVRSLSSEQLFDSLCLAAGRSYQKKENRSGSEDDKTARGQFFIRFAEQEPSTDASTSILQALHLMSGKFMAEVMTAKSDDVVTTITNATSLDDRHRIEELFLHVLSRRPGPQETARFARFIGQGNRRDRLADLLWVLLNSSEFRFNH